MNVRLSHLFAMCRLTRCQRKGVDVFQGLYVAIAYVLASINSDIQTVLLFREAADFRRFMARWEA